MSGVRAGWSRRPLAVCNALSMRVAVAPASGGGKGDPKSASGGSRNIRPWASASQPASQPAKHLFCLRNASRLISDYLRLNKRTFPKTAVGNLASKPRYVMVKGNPLLPSLTTGGRTRKPRKETKGKPMAAQKRGK